jgi:hypothetical protein
VTPSKAAILRKERPPQRRISTTASCFSERTERSNEGNCSARQAGTLLLGGALPTDDEGFAGGDVGEQAESFDAGFDLRVKLGDGLRSITVALTAADSAG